MSDFQLDTSGYVARVGTPESWQTPMISWPDLSPFVQGYVEALFTELWKPETRGWKHSPAHGGYIKDSHRRPEIPLSEWRSYPSDVDADEAWEIDSDGNYPAFSDLAPETLARIIEDCATLARRAGYMVAADAEQGALTWRQRQAGEISDFPPLTLSLGEDGKVRLLEDIR